MAARDHAQTTCAATPKSAAPENWITKSQPALEQVIEDFKRRLPGWWYSVCECHVSCDASCAPTTESADIALVRKGNAFDEGFHADLRQPSTLAEALLSVMCQALAAKRALGPQVSQPIREDQ